MRKPTFDRIAAHSFCVVLFLGACSNGNCAWSAPAQKNRKAHGCAMIQDPVAIDQFVSFFREYHRAVATADLAFLTLHTRFPFPFGQASFDMEAKPQQKFLQAAVALVAAKEELLWPAVLVPKNAADFQQFRRGQQKCSDPVSPEVADFQKGEPAFAANGREVTFTYLSNPCEAETHFVTLRFVCETKGWQLAERAVRMGSKSGEGR